MNPLTIVASIAAQVAYVIRDLLRRWLCERRDVHDTFPKRAGICARCERTIDKNGNAL